jgi:hypothetical protein
MRNCACIPKALLYECPVDFMRTCTPSFWLGFLALFVRFWLLRQIAKTERRELVVRRTPFACQKTFLQRWGHPPNESSHN